MSFDFAWIFSMIMANLHWLFALFMFAVITHDGKRPIWQFLVVVALLWAIVDIEHFMSLAFVPIIIFVPVDWTIKAFRHAQLKLHILLVEVL